jgi:CubicO group peptidase (beta-lactamase class C family)
MPSIIEQAVTRITERIDQIVLDQRLPGLAVGIVRDQELVWSAGFGHADLETKRRPDEETISRVASITKTFTATAIMQLRDDGLLTLDDSLVEHLPEFSAVNPRASTVEGVTIRRMLAHRSGLVTESPFPCWDALEFPSREAMLTALPQTEIVIPQDSAFKYSNLAFGLLGEVISRLSGRPYFEYMQAEILEPLGLTSSVFELTEELRPRMAIGYSRSPYADEFPKAPYALLNGLAACGQLHSTVADLAKWISFQFRTGAAQRSGEQVLRGSSMEEMHRPQYMEPDWSFGYCLGWRARRVGEHVYHEHGGGIHGFASQVMFSKPHRLGVIALANVWPHAGLYEIPSEILETLINAEEGMSGHGETVTTSRTPRELERYLGSYEAQPSIPVNIACRNGSLRLEAPSSDVYSLHAPASLESTDDMHIFCIRGGRGAGERVAFESDADGNVHSFSLGGFVYRKLKPFRAE